MVKMIKRVTLGRMLKKIMKKQEEAKQFVTETGICSVCKKNPVVPDANALRCQVCIDESERLIKELAAESSEGRVLLIGEDE